MNFRDLFVFRGSGVIMLSDREEPKGQPGALIETFYSILAEWMAGWLAGYGFHWISMVFRRSDVIML